MFVQEAPFLLKAPKKGNQKKRYFLLPVRFIQIGHPALHIFEQAVQQARILKLVKTWGRKLSEVHELVKGIKQGPLFKAGFKHGGFEDGHGTFKALSILVVELQMVKLVGLENAEHSRFDFIPFIVDDHRSASLMNV